MSDNVESISLPSKTSVDESCTEKFLKAIRSGPVYLMNLMKTVKS